MRGEGAAHHTIVVICIDVFIGLSQPVVGERWDRPKTLLLSEDGSYLDMRLRNKST